MILNFFIKNIILILFLVFVSCDKDGTIVHSDGTVHDSTNNGEDYSIPDQENNLNGDGCSGDNLCYSLDDVYFDFNSTEAFQTDFYKFNYANIQENAPHDQNSDILTVKSFNNTWLIGVPASSVVENSDNEVLIFDSAGDSYIFTNQSIIEQVADPDYCNDIDPVDGECDAIIDYIEDEISLSSTQLENIEEIKWNVSQGRYDIDPIQSDQFNQSYLYSQPYEKIYLVSVIDPELYDIYGDLILVDQTENVTREYDIESILENGEAVEAYREASYYTQYTYLDQIDALISQVNTDCNNNYQVDADSEWVIFDGYGNDTPSFENWCLSSGGNFNFDSTALCNSGCQFTNVSGEGDAACNILSKDVCSNALSCSLDDPVEPDDCDTLSNNQCTSAYYCDLFDEDYCNGLIELICDECEVNDDDCNSTCLVEQETVCNNETYCSYDSGNSQCTLDLGVENSDVYLCETNGVDQYSCNFVDNSIPQTTMEDFCWEFYAGNNDYNFSEQSRLTGNCYTATNPNSKIQYLSGDLLQYQLTFCDRGNNYYDPEEFFIDQYDDNAFGANLNQGIEPFEDRNCNNQYDSAEIIPSAINGNGWSDECSGYVSNRLGLQYCDSGNNLWDQGEELNPVCQSALEGTQGAYSSYEDYQCLFELGDRDDKLIVDYSSQYMDSTGDGAPDDLDSDGLTDGPEALTSIFPRASFYDTGTDGCYDIFEDGNGGCLCEFNNCSETVPSCEEYLASLGLMNGADQDSEGNFLGDINKDGKISDLDIALALSSNGLVESPYNYGQCNNGYSGTKEDCCIHQGCTWENDDCTFNEGDCEIDSLTDWWIQRLDPNCDNYQTLDSNCTNSSETEFNGSFEGQYIDDNDVAQDNGNELSKNYIDDSLAPSDDEDEDPDYIVSMEEYCALSESDKASYRTHYYDEPSITTRHLDYNNDGVFDLNEGGDEIEIIRHQNYYKNYSTKVVIVDSKNTLKSHPVIDQLDFDDSQNLSACSDLPQNECDNNLEYTWCVWQNDECIVDYLATFNSMIDNHHLIKTEFKNSEGLSDYDYMIFSKTDKDVVKMIHPYYHFAEADQFPNDFDDFSSTDFWQGLSLEADTLIYTSNGNIVNGQYFHSLYNVNTVHAEYEVVKEYAVSHTSANLVYPQNDPTCGTLNETDCGNTDEFWCSWDTSESECYTAIKQSNITDCLLVSRVIETTAVGSDKSFQLKSDTYFKPGYGIVKEDLFIHWDDLPWLESPFTPISSIEYIAPVDNTQLMTTQGNVFYSQETINVEDFENIEDFDYSPFKITNTLGIQRIEYPINY